MKNSKTKTPPFYNFCYDFVKITGALPVLLCMRPKIYCPRGQKNPRGAVLISANHRSLLDPVIMHVAFPARRLHCLATKDLYNTKTKAKFFNLMHCVEVDKENFSVSSFHDVVTRLKCGRAVVIFPEGGLNTDKEESIHPFKCGAVLMAHKAAAPILPVYIVKREHWYQRQRIVIGEPINVAEKVGRMPTMEQLNGLTEELRAEEMRLREYFESLPIYEKLNKKQTNIQNLKRN